MAELKRCPFCGSTNLDVDDYSNVPHLCNAIERVECNYCSGENIEADWNTRSLPAALDVVLEAVQAKINEDGQHTVRALLYAELCAMLEALKSTVGR